MDVCLVSMPFATLPRPSLALGLLKAVLHRADVDCGVMYPSLDFAARVGTRAYHLGSHLCPTELMVGEWAFAEAAFGGDAPPPEPYLEGIMRAFAPSDRGAAVVRALRFMRREAAPFVAEVAARVVASGARIVGCTTTMEQTVASLALLREIRRMAPHVVTMMGGANCETRMGLALHRSFPWVDFVVSGEADGLFPRLCRDVLAGTLDTLPAGVLGPSHRTAGWPRELPRATYRDLDALPMPDFDEYVDALRASPLSLVIHPSLPLETSRGCWWGAVHHCTFCGLNGSSMAYRSKSAERALEEMEYLAERYNISRMYSVDNILDHKYLRSVIPALAERKHAWSLFFELKANLREDQVRLLREAGTVWMQPGVESLHSAHLALMDKGIQGWQNVMVLKWAREQGIRLSWLLLWGMPGEQDAWFDEVADVLPFLEHLQPPFGVVRIRFDRYSVYHSRAAEYHLRLVPTTALRHIFPLPPDVLEDLAYCFREVGDADVFSDLAATPIAERDLALRPGVARVIRAAASWRKAFDRTLPPLLSVTDDGGALDFLDTRRCAVDLRHRVEGEERAVYLACQEAPRRQHVAERCGLSAARAAEAVEALLDRHLLLALDGRLIALALSGPVPPLVHRDDSPGGAVARDMAPEPVCVPR